MVRYVPNSWLYFHVEPNYYMGVDNKQASYLEGGPLLWILPLYLHVNKKSDDDDDDKNPMMMMMMIKIR